LNVCSHHDRYENGVSALSPQEVVLQIHELGQSVENVTLRRFENGDMHNKKTAWHLPCTTIHLFHATSGWLKKCFTCGSDEEGKVLKKA